MPMLGRRAVLLGAAATLGTPLVAQSDPWAAVAERVRALDQCRAIVIRQSGAEVLSQAFRGPSLGNAVPVKSVSKTIVAALTGAALDRGELPSLDATLGEVAPNLIPSGADPRVAWITVENLVTMQAGLERTSGSNYGPWVNSRNWVANALSRPFVAEPGAQMLYSTGSFHILGAVLSDVSGRSLLDLARIRLGQPLGIDIPAWTRDPQGRYLGGNEMALTLDGMARFGEMYRMGGQFGGALVLSADWVARSLEPRTRSQFSGLSYGYGWFLGQADGVQYALARGYGGQVICTVPALEMTLALTSDPNLPARSAGHFGDIMRLIEGEVIPLARSQLA
ncbi:MULTISPECIES: serine hydrolase [unclassified Yoonia]|uniref:serine hydrolase domain-containing protein n=1 Tax=unclassified Yoonia TaxID=2629118 RepID=UPI002B002165|nr:MULTISPECIES: serine hydrolase [unclassified Yoonia]